MTAFLKDIFTKTGKMTKENFQKYFYDELVELLHDEDLIVRLEALDIAVDIMQTKVSEEQIE